MQTAHEELDSPERPLLVKAILTLALLLLPTVLLFALKDAPFALPVPTPAAVRQRGPAVAGDNGVEHVRYLVQTEDGTFRTVAPLHERRTSGAFLRQDRAPVKYVDPRTGEEVRLEVEPHDGELWPVPETQGPVRNP